ncbi:oligosaccharide flippase family protein [Curvibacter sp. HBC28]|uniref:Oligosaccharide flippase family protein n=1 Tax=Curvibacter microcysteis TaxID=3026419 RepID=A0ABT5MDD4_9BURK|nr:oligosaccharide flippase family protein [Curvibacter sp. HBC28]MDD0814587.1 oligosaccharide flippase family protein [Curvibacter sp. HBC28]
MIGFASILSVLQNLVAAITVFILYRFLIDNVGAAQVGIWSIVVASTAVAKLGDLGFSGGVVNFVSRYFFKGQRHDAAVVIQTALLTTIFLTGLLLVCAYPLFNYALPFFIVKESDVEIAKKILPVALTNLWLGSAVSCVQSGLDACNEIIKRNIVAISSNLVLLGASLFFIPTDGIHGAAIAQLIQTLYLLLVSWIILRRILSLPWFPFVWSFSKFKEMFLFSFAFQFNSLLGLFFDPFIKLALSRFGDLSSVAYYEMCGQLISKVRSLIVSANQVLTPKVAAISVDDKTGLGAFYQQVFSIHCYFYLPIFTVLVASFYIFSYLLTGAYSERFIIFGMILSFGWFVNGFNIPAYFFYLGVGRMRWNILSQLINSISCVVFCMVLGHFFGGYGVICAVTVSLLMGSWIPIWALHVDYSIYWKPLFFNQILFGFLGFLVVFVGLLSLHEYFHLPNKFIWIFIALVYSFVGIAFLADQRFKLFLINIFRGDR